jgi:hypothetical protein
MVVCGVLDHHIKHLFPEKGLTESKFPLLANLLIARRSWAANVVAGAGHDPIIAGRPAI